MESPSLNHWGGDRHNQNRWKKGRKEEKGRKETRTFVFVSYCGGYSIGREVVIVNLKWAFEDLHF